MKAPSSHGTTAAPMLLAPNSTPVETPESSRNAGTMTARRPAQLGGLRLGKGRVRQRPQSPMSAFERGAGDQKPCAGDAQPNVGRMSRKRLVRGLVAIP